MKITSNQSRAEALSWLSGRAQEVADMLATIGTFTPSEQATIFEHCAGLATELDRGLIEFVGGAK